MKKILLSSLILFSKSLFAGKIVKTFVAASLTLSALFSGMTYLGTFNNIKESAQMNPYDYFFLPTHLSNDQGCLLATTPTLQEDIMYNTKADHKIAEIAYEGIKRFEETKERNLRHVKALMKNCPKEGYHRHFMRLTSSSYPLQVLGPKDWQPSEATTKYLISLGYNRSKTELPVDRSYTDTESITITSGFPDQDVFGCLFLMPFAHNGQNNTKAQFVAQDLAVSLRQKNLLESFEIEFSKCIDDPEIPVKKLFCTELGDCVAVAFRFVGYNQERLTEVNKAILDAINDFAPQGFHTEDPNKCTMTDDMCCAVQTFEKVEL